MSEPLPTGAFDSLLLKLATVLEQTQQPEGSRTPQARQAILQATNDFKNALQRAKDLANGLPGGELVVEEQEEIIAMLERIREHNKNRLATFGEDSPLGVDGINTNHMDVDSTASTPLP